MPGPVCACWRAKKATIWMIYTFILPHNALLPLWWLEPSLCLGMSRFGTYSQFLSLNESGLALDIALFLLSLTCCIFFLIFTWGHFSLLLERKGERKKGRERKKHWFVASHICLDLGSFMPRLGIKSTTQVCALTGNGTHNLLVTG